MRRVTLFAAGTALAALVLSGCGAKQQAADQGQNQGGSADFSSLKILAASVGEKSAAKQSAHMTMSMETAGQTIKAEGDMRLGNDVAMDINMTLAGVGETKMLLVDDAFYIKLPKEVQPGKQWIKIDVNGNDALSKALAGTIKQTKENGDPSQVLKQLEDAGEITAKKQENLNGVSTTHYTVLVDAKKQVEKLTPELRPAMEEAIKAGVDKYPVEVWLDKENLPVRMSLNTPFVNPATKKPDTVKVTMDYSDWGKAVVVTAPPADQVGELPKR